MLSVFLVLWVIFSYTFVVFIFYSNLRIKFYPLPWPWLLPVWFHLTFISLPTFWKVNWCFFVPQLLRVQSRFRNICTVISSCLEHLPQVTVWLTSSYHSVQYIMTLRRPVFKLKPPPCPMCSSTLSISCTCACVFLLSPLSSCICPGAHLS